MVAGRNGFAVVGIGGGIFGGIGREGIPALGMVIALLIFFALVGEGDGRYTGAGGNLDEGVGPVGIIEPGFLPPLSPPPDLPPPTSNETRGGGVYELPFGYMGGTPAFGAPA